MVKPLVHETFNFEGASVDQPLNGHFVGVDDVEAEVLSGDPPHLASFVSALQAER